MQPVDFISESGVFQRLFKNFFEFCFFDVYCNLPSDIYLSFTISHRVFALCFNLLKDLFNSDATPRNSEFLILGI